jgi:DNA (cytosine-5)-methyltransferase 1
MSDLTYGSLFAGIGGFCLGFHRAGLRCAWRVEVEPNCCRVLTRHWPADHLHKDVRDFHADGSVPRADVVTFGFPCQDVSVAGRRAGLAGERSGLFWEACRIIDEGKPRIIVCENVPGLLSSNRGRDMGAVVAALADLGFGIAWRVLDAQWFGVAQRRKRLFIVGVSGADVRGAAEILLEPESVCGHSAPRRPAREAVARAAAGSTGECRAAVDATLNQRQPRADDSVSCDDLADPICTREGKTWTHEGSKNFRGRNLIAYTKAKRAQSSSDDETWIDGEVAPTQNAFDQGESRSTTVVVPGTWWDGGDVSQTLDAVLAKGQAMPERGRFPAVLSEQGEGLAARRLVPVEAERLQGFPDNWSAVGGDGKPLSDSARYRALGNAVCVPVAEWIARRIVASCAPRDGAAAGGERTS